MTDQELDGPGSAILFVDDEPVILTALARTFGRERYPIFLAQGGEEALALLAASPVKVVVADQRMPGMSGSELLQEIGRRWPLIGRVILTGHPGRDVMIRGLEAEIDFLIYKPWDDESLRRAVRRLITEVDRSSASRRDLGSDPWQDVGGEGG
jgi:DNA-binding NtrC family response regulator